MKTLSHILILLAFLSTSPALAHAHTLTCPTAMPGNKVGAAITSGRPRSKDEWRKLLVVPPFYGKPEGWSINDVAKNGRKKLYLSCAYSDGSFVSLRIPTKKRKCMTRGHGIDLTVECSTPSH